MPASRPGDAPHRLCLDCWQGLIYDRNEYFRCEVHYGQDLPGSAERARRDEFRELVESGRLPITECVRCWNGRRRNPHYRCPEHRLGNAALPENPNPVPELSEAVINPKIIIPAEGVINPYTGREMCQMEIDAIMAKPENSGKSFAEVMQEMKEMKNATQKIQKVKIVEAELVLELDFLGIWNLFTDVIQATGTEVSNELDRALGRALRGHLEYQIRKHPRTEIKKKEEKAASAVQVPR